MSSAETTVSSAYSYSTCVVTVLSTRPAAAIQTSVRGSPICSSSSAFTAEIVRATRPISWICPSSIARVSCCLTHCATTLNSSSPVRYPTVPTILRVPISKPNTLFICFSPQDFIDLFKCLIRQPIIVNYYRTVSSVFLLTQLTFKNLIYLCVRISSGFL